MTYLRCGACGFTAPRKPMSLIGSCPRCRATLGYAILLTDRSEAPSYARTEPRRGGAPVSERGMGATG
jgi:hypothetical protein